MRSESVPEKIGRYEILSILGRGGMGVVYLARDPGLDRTVAIKTLSRAEAGSQDEDSNQLIERFVREARAVAKSDHTNIVTVYHVGKHGDEYYIVMEYVKGKTLSWFIKSQQTLSLEVKLNLVKQICLGLQKAHEEGLVHRDIKPSNIMVNKNGVIKIMDFGLVHTANSELTATNQIMGTANYMSPEQLSNKPVDQRTDIFSLGTVFYELVTGEKAFSGDSTSSIMYKIVFENPPFPSEISSILLNSPVDGIILKALSKKPEDRYSTCGELLTDIELVLAGETANAVAPTTDNEMTRSHSSVTILNSPSIVAALQNPFDQPIEIEIDGDFSALLKRKQYVETRLPLGKHRIALRHREKLVKSIKYTSEHDFTIDSDITCIQVTTRLASTDFRILDRLPGFFAREYEKVEPEG